MLFYFFTSLSARFEFFVMSWHWITIFIKLSKGVSTLTCKQKKKRSNPFCDWCSNNRINPFPLYYTRSSFIIILHKKITNKLKIYTFYIYKINIYDNTIANCISFKYLQNTYKLMQILKANKSVGTTYACMVLYFKLN